MRTKLHGLAETFGFRLAVEDLAAQLATKLVATESIAPRFRPTEK